MTDRLTRRDEDARRADDLAPETSNSEQDQDADEQAQSVADDALTHATAPGLGDSEKVSTGEASDDVQDLVDHMQQMDSSGVIDFDAFRGEPNHDDNVDKYGPAAKVDRHLRGDGT